jgi:ribosomal protein L35
VKGAHAHHSHMLTFSKTRDQKRNLRSTFHLADPDAKKIKKELLPYG